MQFPGCDVQLFCCNIQFCAAITPVLPQWGHMKEFLPSRTPGVLPLTCWAPAVTVAVAVAQVAQALQPGIKHYLVKHNLSSTYKNQAYPRFKHCPKVKHNPKKHKHYLNQAHFTRKSISFPGVHDSSVTQFSDRVEFSSSTTQFQ